MKIAVGGMIGSGKSTLADSIGSALGLPVMQEYEDGDEVFNTLLGWLYEGKPNTEILLQIYFIHAHWLNQKKFGSDFVVDRDIIEHWIFAYNNLKKHPEVMNMYNGLFHAYLNSITKPDVYIILDINWETFKNRIMTRGRKQEIENFELNENYFKDLISNYTQKLVAQCEVHDIPYIIVDVNNLTKDEVSGFVIQHLKGRFKKQLKEKKK